ncbi:MAG: dephospho-CoA kinase [Rhodothermaceae bacterium]|nr:dephospho-CoA kinase [Rhodothermaceae bacterium]
MITLGLTGGIGSGKSAVAAHLATKPGVRVIYADDEAKRLMHEDVALRAALVERFGREIYDTEGRLDRSALAARVFADPDELAALNALVHPAVREAMLAHIEEARCDGIDLLVYEAALLYEVGADAHLDGVAVVDAPVETRIARVMARDGVLREQVLDRMRHQLPPEDLRARADFVIVNTQDLVHLHTRAEQLYKALLFAD